MALQFFAIFYNLMRKPDLKNNALPLHTSPFSEASAYASTYIRSRVSVDFHGSVG
jgi:hypothetical protein